MDPISLTITISKVASTAGSIIIGAHRYLSSISHRKDAIRTLISELSALQSNLARLDELLRSQEMANRRLVFEHTSVLRSCTAACEKKLDVMLEKLGPSDGSGLVSKFRAVGSKLTWPFSESEHQKAVEDLRAFSQWLQFALSVDGCSLLAQTSGDVLKILGNQLEIFNSLSALEKKMGELQSTTESQLRIVEADKKSKTRTELLDWISNMDYGHKHETTRSHRLDGTGKWLLGHSKYVGWLNGSSETNILWCPGSQGSGKTFLVSAVIDDLSSLCTGGDSVLAYMYFDYRSQDIQTPTAVFASILRQCLEHLVEIPERISNTYNARVTSGPPLAEQELQDFVLDSLGSSKAAYVVIDALDECAEAHQWSLLDFISRLRDTSRTRVLVTSRQHLPEINDSFKGDRQILIEAAAEDLGLYISQKLNDPRVKKRVNKSLGQNIADRLLEEAKGMFLLVKIQLENILHEPTPGEIADALRKLSRSLPEAFRDTVDRIHRQHPSCRRLGLGALMWISHAKRKLTSAELCEALSISPDRSGFDRDYIPSADAIVEYCQGLVWVDAATDEIAFIHSAVQDYLDESAADLFPSADADLAATCLRYLMLADFGDGPRIELLSIRALLGDYSFLPYAASFWGRHVKEWEMKRFDGPNFQADGPDDIRPLLANFLHADSQNAAALSSQILEFNRGRRRHYWRYGEAVSVTPLHMAARFGLCHTLQALLEANEADKLDINRATNIVGSTPIILAASGGHVEAIQILLEHGADPTVKNWYGNALHCAAEAGQAGSIQSLVAWGMELDVRRADGYPPLSCALDNDGVAAFEMLVKCGADIDFVSHDPDDMEGNGYSILHEAILMNSVGIVDLILRNSWVDVGVRSSRGLTPVHVAACRPQTAMLKRLLDAGAEVDAKDNLGRTPLVYARRAKADDAVSVLLERGAVSESEPAVEREPATEGEPVVEMNDTAAAMVSVEEVQTVRTLVGIEIKIERVS